MQFHHGNDTLVVIGRYVSSKRAMEIFKDCDTCSIGVDLTGRRYKKIIVIYGRDHRPNVPKSKLAEAAKLEWFRRLPTRLVVDGALIFLD